MKEQEINPLAGDQNIAQSAMAHQRAANAAGIDDPAENREKGYVHGAVDMRRLYEIDRAASRLLIEKLRDYCVQAKSDATDTANAEPDAEINQVWLDGITATIDEANAFLKP